MASRRIDDAPKKRRRATTPEERENQMIAAAIDLAEKQLDQGTASAQVISHYLKLGSSRERLEQARLKADVELQHARKEAIESAQRVEAMYGEALNAMRRYAGMPLDDDENL